MLSASLIILFFRIFGPSKIQRKILIIRILTINKSYNILNLFSLK